MIYCVFVLSLKRDKNKIRLLDQKSPFCDLILPVRPASSKSTIVILLYQKDHAGNKLNQITFAGEEHVHAGPPVGPARCGQIKLQI